MPQRPEVGQAETGTVGRSRSPRASQPLPRQSRTGYQAPPQQVHSEDQVQEMLMKLSLQTAQQVREHSGVLLTTFLMPSTLSPIQSSLEKGQQYSQAVQALPKGESHSYGPPHVHKLLAFLPALHKKLLQNQEMEDKEMLPKLGHLITVLEAMTMDNLQQLILVFRHKEAYFNQKTSKGVPMTKLTTCFADKEVYLTMELGTIVSFKEFLNSAIQACHGVQLKMGQAASSGLERGLQTMLDNKKG